MSFGLHLKRCSLFFEVRPIQEKREYVIVIDNDTLAHYDEFYFSIHKKAKKRPIEHPYHESINKWMIMKRPKMNALKQKWKDLIKWIVDNQGYSNLRIDRCEIRQVVYYNNNRRHDVDNSTPKFILDGLVDGGMVVDDDSKHICKLVLECLVDIERPRTELYITAY